LAWWIIIGLFTIIFVHILCIRIFCFTLALLNKNKDKMKTIKVTYTETYIVTEERIIEVSNATFNKLQNKDSFVYQRLLNDMDGVTCVIDSPTERDQTFMDIELATEKDIKEVSFTLDF